MTAAKRLPGWLLAFIAAPAFVAIWSGWIGLAGLCGFGEVRPLPGIVRLHVNTAFCLPLGVEAYAALALGAWLRPGTQGTARTFARWSALGSLTLGMLGQISYHLLAADHARRAPDIVVVLVACLPVVVLGCAVALMHLLRSGPESAEPAADAPAPAEPAAPAPAPGAPERVPAVLSGLNGHARAAADLWGEDARAGNVPSLRAIRSGLSVGQANAA